MFSFFLDFTRFSMFAFKFLGNFVAIWQQCGNFWTMRVVQQSYLLDAIHYSFVRRQVHFAGHCGGVLNTVSCGSTVPAFLLFVKIQIAFEMDYLDLHGQTRLVICSDWIARRHILATDLYKTFSWTCASRDVSVFLGSPQNRRGNSS